MKKQTKSIIDLILSSGFVVVIFVVYFKISREISIYITAAAIVVLTLTYIPNIKRYFYLLKYRSLIKILKKYKIIREPSLIQTYNLDPLSIHRELFILSKFWDERPLILYVKNYYLFIHEKVIDDIIRRFRKSKKNDNSMKDFLVDIKETYKLKDNREVNVIIGHLRKKKMLDS